MRTRSALSLVAAASASVVVGAIVAQGTAAPATPKPAAAGAPIATSPSPTARPGHLIPPPSSRPTSSTPSTSTGRFTYAPPRPGRYTYSGPGGATVTEVAVSPMGSKAWRLDESIVANSAFVQRRQQIWNAAGDRVLAVWEAGQAQPCVWSNPPADIAFPLTTASTWSVDASCKVASGTSSRSVTHVRGSFRAAGATRLRIAGRAVEAWLVTGTEVTTVDGTVNGHRFHTVDSTTTRVWFLPSVGLPGRTELTGTVSITTDSGTKKHRIGQVTQLESLTPQ